MEKAKYDVFLSHATPDKPVVEALARILQDEGIEPWLDKWNLVPGELVLDALEKALDECATCVVCIGPGDTGPWQDTEVDRAITRRIQEKGRGYRVFAVFLPGVSPKDKKLRSFLDQTRWVELRDLQDKEALHAIISGIRGVAPGRGPGQGLAGDCPYPGLRPFALADAKYFFGREDLIQPLLEKWDPLQSGCRFLAIVGPSGSGKSSLAQAGLLGALKKGKLPGSEDWPVALCRTRAQPLEDLAHALSRTFPSGRSPLDEEAVVAHLAQRLAADAGTLDRTARVGLSEGSDGRRLVVLADQFEEIFTLCREDKDRRAFIENLLFAATAPEGRTAVILTLRADFYEACAPYGELAKAISEHQHYLLLMKPEELQRAIEQPARLAGLSIEDGLTDRLLDEMKDQPGMLPLLQHALFQIWEQGYGSKLTVKTYRQIGRVEGALQKYADGVFAGFTKEEQEICRRVFLKLVQIDEQDKVAKRRLAVADLVPETEPDHETVVSRLVEARLLTAGKESGPTVELAHEVLITAWSRLQDWVKQNREDLRIRHRLEGAMAEWIDSNRDRSCLYRGSRLALAEEWVELHPGELGSTGREFLDASRALREEEYQRELTQARQRAEEREQANRKLKRLVIAVTATAVVAVIAALAFFFSQRESERKRLISVANDLAHQSVTVQKTNPALGLLLSIEAMRLADQGRRPRLASTEESLRRALNPFRGRPLPTGKVRATAVSADGTWLAVAGSDGALSTWNLTENGPVEGPSFPRPPADPLGELVAMGPGGRWLLAASKTHSSLFDLSTKNASITVDLGGEDWLKDNDPFSPDGRWLLTRQSRDSWILRDLGAPGRPKVAILRIEPSASIFSPDGRWLAVADPGTLKVWDLTAPSERPKFQMPGNENTETLAFSSDSRWLAATGGAAASRTVQAWRIDPAQGLGSAVRLENCTWSASAAPALTDPLLVSRIDDLSNCLASEGGIGHSQPGLIHQLILRGRWIIEQGGEEAPRVFELLPDPNAANVEPQLTAAVPGVVAVSSKGWRLSVDPQVQLRGPRGPRPVTGAEKALPPWAFSPDARWLAAAGADGRPLVWRVQEDGATSAPISFRVRFHHSSPVSVLVFSPDGRWLATGDTGGFARLWDLRAPNAEPRSLTNSQKGVLALAFGLDSHLIATAAGDGHIRLRKLNGTPAEVDLPERPTGFEGQPSTLAFLPDGRLALGGARTRVELWDPKGRSIFLDNRVPRIFKLMASPKGDRLFSSTEDGTLQIWTLEEAEPQPLPLQLPLKTGRHFAVTADGNGLWAVDGTGKLYRWELRTEKLLETACRAAGRNLTPTEWRTYISSESYAATEPCPEFPKAFD